MGRSAPITAAEARTDKKGTRTAFLIAVQQKRETVRVYAVVAATADAALALVKEVATDRMEIEIVGVLSRDLTRRLRLKPGEMRLI